MRVLGWQHNKEFNDAVNLWRTHLLGGDKPQRTYEYPANAGAFRFVIRRAPSFAEVAPLQGVKTAALEARFRSLIRQKGLQITEPELVFSNRAGRGIAKDAHPVRGILRNRPFDFPLTNQEFGSEIRLERVS